MDYTTIAMLATTQDGRHADGSCPLVRVGTSFKRYGAREGAANPVEVDVLTPSSLGRYGFQAAEFEYLVLDVSGRLEERIDEFATREGDVVMSLFPPFPAIYVGPEFEDVLVPAGMVLLRLDDETRRIVDPRYLAGWLSSETVARQILPSKLSLACAGVRRQARKKLSEVDLLDVVVPLPPIEEQRKLGELVVSAAESEVRRWAQQQAEERVVEFFYWEKCVEPSDEGEASVDNTAGRHFAGPSNAGNATDAIRKAQSSYLTDGGDVGGPYPTTTGNGYVAAGSANSATTDFLKQPAVNGSATSAPQGTLSVVRNSVDGGSFSGYDHRQLARTITPEWYESYVRGSNEASERFLDSFRAIAATEESSDAPPGEVRAGPGESPPRAYGTDDDSESPPGYDWGDPYDVKIF